MRLRALATVCPHIAGPVTATRFRETLAGLHVLAYVVLNRLNRAVERFVPGA